MLPGDNNGYIPALVFNFRIISGKKLLILFKITSSKSWKISALKTREIRSKISGRKIRRNFPRIYRMLKKNRFISKMTMQILLIKCFRIINVFLFNFYSFGNCPKNFMIGNKLSENSRGPRVRIKNAYFQSFMNSVKNKLRNFYRAFRWFFLSAKKLTLFGK